MDMAASVGFFTPNIKARIRESKGEKGMDGWMEGGREGGKEAERAREGKEKCLKKNGRAIRKQEIKKRKETSKKGDGRERKHCNAQLLTPSTN